MNGKKDLAFEFEIQDPMEQAVETDDITASIQLFPENGPTGFSL